MSDLSQQSIDHIRYHMERGDATLVLGAGAARDCLNRDRKPLCDGRGLAGEICASNGLPYNGEPLPDVIDGVAPTDAYMEELLRRQYQGCFSSDALDAIFSFAWRRIYTFNIDDCIESIRSPASRQILHSYNAITDKVQPLEGGRILHVVHLHGFVRQIERGYIFSGVQYDKYQRDGLLAWYQEFIRDCLSGCAIFIGTRLEEPIFRAELEAARRDSKYPKCYLVNPDS